MNSDTNKTFAFVALSVIPEGEQIKFTDNGWFAAGSFRTGEGIITWTSPVGGVSAGTVITINTTTAGTVTATTGLVAESGDVNFSTSGDQILAYQGLEASPTFLFGLNNEGTTVWQADATNTNTSALPSGLTNGTNAVALTETDNVAYSGITSGTPSQLFAAICTPANWTLNDTTNVNPPASFTVNLGPTPTITGGTTTTTFTTTYGTASAAQSFSIGGTNLTADITATAPSGFEVSNDGTTYGPTATFTQSGGTANGTVHIRLKQNAAVTGTYNSVNIVLSSTGATSVNIATPASGNAVAAKGLTITGLTGSNKTYDGNTTASFTGTPAYLGLENGETFSVTGTPVATFATPGAGIGKTITVTGFTAPSTNYTLTQPTLSANIDGAPLTITANDVTKTLGATLTGGPGSTAFTSLGLIPPETIGSVTITYGTGAASGDPAATYVDQVTPSAATGGTFDPANYTITYVKGDIIVSGTPLITLTGTLTAVDTVYGTPSPTPTTFTAVGSALGGNLTVTPPSGFEASLSAGSGYTTSLTLTQNSGSVGPVTVYVRLAATTPKGTYSGNVTVSGGGADPKTIATASSEVTAKALTVTGITADNKEYNGDTSATLSGTPALVGVEPADVGNVGVGGSPIATFASANVADDIAVTVTGYTLIGASAGNYTLTQPTGLLADITAKALTVSGAAVTTKPYDGTAAAVITGTLNGIIGMDDVSLVGTGTFADPNVANGIPVTATCTLTGAKAGNYSVTQPTGLTGNIIKGTQTITFADLAVKTTADAPFSLTANASSGLTITYTSSDLDVATIAGDLVIITGIGVTQITATQAGNSNYEPAVSVIRPLGVVAPGGPASIYLTGNTTYTQNFDSLGTASPTTAYPNGWTGYKHSGTGTMAVGTTVIGNTSPAFTTGNGSGNAATIYNFGSAAGSDRALGALASGGFIGAIGVSFVNLTGTTIEGSNLALGLTAEQWRTRNSVGPAGATQLVFEWKIGGSITDPTGWNSESAFNIVEVLINDFSNTTVDGNNPTNRLVTAPSTFSSLTGWESGQPLHIRWRDNNDDGNDAGMAIDDFQLVLSGVQTPTPKLYWDSNGSTAGAGGPTPTGIWGTDTFWSGSSSGVAGTAGWTVGNDAVFSAGADATGTYSVSLNGVQDIGGLFIQEGAVTLLGNALNFTDTTPVVNIAAGATGIINSEIQGSSGLLKQGPGTLILDGVNTFIGNLTIGSGTLSIDSDTVLGNTDNDIILGGGALQVTATTTLAPTRTLSGSGQVIPDLGVELTLESSLGVTGLNMAGPGALTLNGPSNNMGALVFAAAGTISGTNLSATGITANHATGTATISDTLSLGAVTRTVEVTNAAATLDLPDVVVLNGTGNTRLSKTGAGTLILGGENTDLNKVALGNQAAVPTPGGKIIFDNKNALGNTMLFFNYGTLEATTNLTGAESMLIGLSIGGRSGSPSVLQGGNMEFVGPGTITSFSGTSGDIVLVVDNHTTLGGALTRDASLGGSIAYFAIQGDGKLTLSGSLSGLTTPLKLGGTVTLELNTPELGNSSFFGLISDVLTLAADTTLAVGTIGTTNFVTVYDGLNGAANSVLHFDINGTNRGTASNGYDALVFAKNNNGTNDVVGPVTFAGKIDVDFGPSFEPEEGQVFDLLDWDASITPDFTGIDFSLLPPLTGDLVWKTENFATTGEISIEGTIPKARFAVSSQNVSESVGSVTVTVNIIPPPSLTTGQTVTIPYTVSGTALSGTDFTITASPLKLGPGESSKTITINVKPDTLNAGAFGESANETVIITLGTPTGPGGVVLGKPAQTTFTLNIANDYRAANFQVGGTSLAAQSKIVNTGSPVDFKVTPVGSAVLKLQWLKNGANLGAALSPLMSGVEQTYSIASATLANAGKYGAKVTNPLAPLGIATPTVGELMVVEQLAAYATPRLTLGKTGTNLLLTANAAGNGIQYRWFKNNVEILDTETAAYSGMASKTLVIKALAAGNEGVYQCRVRSSLADLAGQEAFSTAFKVRTAVTPSIDSGSFPMGRLPDGNVGAQYSAPLGYTIPIMNDSEGRQTPTVWKATGLPTGLSINATGTITGIPEVSISSDTTYSNVVITATNPAGSISVTTSIVIRALKPNALGTFVAIAQRSGTYAGKNGTLDLGARIDFTTTVNGYVTGKVTIGSAAPYKFPKTRLNAANPLLPTITVPIKRASPLTQLTVTLNIDALTNLVTGKLWDSSATPPAQDNVSGWRNTWNSKAVKLTKCTTISGNKTVVCASTLFLKPGMYVTGTGIPIGAKVDTITNATTFELTLAATASTAAPTLTLTADFGARHFTGLYNFALDVPATPPSDVPLGNGFGSFTVATSGALTLSGKTADGQTLTSSTFVGPNGEVAVYRVLYATTQKGSLVGSLDIDPGSAADFSDNTLDGTVSWMRPADTASNARLYKSGFAAFDLTAVGGRYVVPVSPNLILGMTTPGNARLLFSEGGLNARTNPSPTPPAPNVLVAVDAGNKLTVATDPATTTTVTNSADIAKLGKFKGTFKLTDDNPRTIAPVTPAVVTRSVSYEGLIIKEGTTYRGYGFFILDQLPGDSPLTTTTTSPKLSGQVVFEKDI